MSDLHELCYLHNRPITAVEYIDPLKLLLKLGIPSTYTLEEAYNYENEIDEEPKSTTTPLHLICESIPLDYTTEESQVILQMMEQLFLRGAGWSLLNKDGETPGCVLERRNLVGTPFWDVIVDAGVRAEMLLRKMDDIVEFLSDGEEVIEQPVDQDIEQETEIEDTHTGNIQDASNNQEIYLKSKLEYKDDSLITQDKDGVMMQWEDNLMHQGCQSLFKNSQHGDDVNILNIGFGMGIIDTMIQSRHPTKHYICEAHPDVLAKLKQDGWYEKPGVVILSGRWQDTLPELLSQNVFFDGIYYDTFSEHYEDMLELFDLVVGLLKPEGVFSFFNGLGADRFIVYQVYRKLVEIDLNNYGLQVKFTDLQPHEGTLKSKDQSVWKDIKRSYWNCPVYYHPEVEFIDTQEMFSRFGSDSNGSPDGINSKAANLIKMALNSAQLFTNNGNGSRQDSINKITDELSANGKVLHTKTPDLDLMTQPEDVEDDSETRTPTKAEIISGIDISNLPIEVKSKMKKFAKYEQKYPILLDAYKTEKHKTKLITDFEKLLQELTPCSSISESAILFQYLNDLKNKNDLINLELKKVTGDCNSLKEQSKLQLNKFQTVIKNLQQNLSVVEKKLESSDEKVNDLQKKLVMSDEKLTDLEKKLTLSDEKATDLEKKLVTKDEEVLDLQKKLTLLSESHEQVDNSQNEALEKELTEIKEQLETQKKLVTDKELEISQLKESKDLEISQLKQSKEIELNNLKSDILKDSVNDQPMSKSAKKRNKKKKQQDNIKETETVIDSTRVTDLESQLQSKDEIIQSNETALQEKQTHIQQLQDEINSNKDEIENLRDSLKLLGDELVQIKNDSSEKTLHIQHTALITTYEKNVKSLKEQIVELEQTVNDLKLDKQNLESELTNVKSENNKLSPLKEQVTQLEGQFENIKQLNESLNNEKKILIKKNDDLQKIQNDDINLKLELNNLQKTITSKDKNVNDLQSRIKFLEEEKNSVNDKYIELKITLENLKNQIKSSNEQGNKLMTENETLKEEIKKLNLKQSKMSNENAILIKSRDEIKDKLTDLTNLKSNNFDQVENLTRVNEELNMRIRELTKSYESLQEELNDSRTMLQERTRETSTIRKLLVELEEDKQKIGQEYESKFLLKNDEIDNLKFEINKLNKKYKLEINELNDTLNKLKDEIAHGSTTANPVIVKQQDGMSEDLMSNKITKLQDQLLTNETKLKEIEKMNSILKKLNDDSSLKFEKLNKNYKLQQFEIKKLQNDLTQRKSSVSEPPSESPLSKSDSNDEAKVSYIKNVLLGFIEKKDQRSNLLPVMKMVLQLNDNDIDILNNNLK